MNPQMHSVLILEVAPFGVLSRGTGVAAGASDSEVTIGVCRVHCEPHEPEQQDEESEDVLIEHGQLHVISFCSYGAYRPIF